MHVVRIPLAKHFFKCQFVLGSAASRYSWQIHDVCVPIAQYVQIVGHNVTSQLCFLFFVALFSGCSCFPHWNKYLVGSFLIGIAYRRLRLRFNLQSITEVCTAMNFILDGSHINALNRDPFASSFFSLLLLLGN